ncbi:phosphoglycerate kinase [Methanolapillus millepedarum]|uniref:phosphoglycerate kinase n=1 Tax=Methanolapillus millepedarum TaxID=3028296 RepID=UPI0030B87F95
MKLTKDFLTIDDFDVFGKTVLLRVDFNAPMSPEGKILDDARIKSHVKTITDLKDAKVVILAHQSRPGKSDFTTTKPHAEILSKYLGKEVRYVDDIFGSYARSCISAMVPGDVIILENVRFFSEESLDRSVKEHSDSFFVQKLLPYVDFYLNDAFAVSHRSHLSVVGFTENIKSGAGRLMESEIVNLERGLNGERPCVYALGGSKVDDSLHVAENVLSKGSADSVLFSGVVGNVILAAAGFKIGKPNMDLIVKLGYTDQIEIAKEMIQKYGDKIKYPMDVALNADGKRVEATIKEMGKSNYPAYDIGLETIVAYTTEIENAGTVILNGPAGVSENPDFAIGTHEIIRAGTRSKFSIIGGGHISAEVNRLGIEGQFSHISTGGGACIEYLSGVELPGITALENAAKKKN